ncbi:hypothetical protein RFY44_17620 [Acinetobacter bereziniae]|uniref:hypothetical protein n=1 Tax=Acinetobacter bereziniae TaxID=106648 RepID=UPI0028134E38|nr:hypothetical protein [Acinetobacter bereziniae]MDQ9820674.1 hypothetical protein [Acinetobacter bereziniae]
MTTLFIAIGIICIAVIIYSAIQKNSKNISLRDLVKKTFPKYTIIEKFGTIMICEINHRNEPDEKVFIKKGNKKKIEKSGRFIIAEYPYKPTAKELKQDLNKYL